MKQVIKLQVFKSKDKDAPYTICGRLLGIANIMEATKIVQNPEVNSRIATAETKPLTDVVAAIENAQKNPTYNTASSRIVVAIKSIQRDQDVAPIDALKKQLFISAPITMVSETVVSAKDNNKITKATMDCDDNSLLTIEEMEE